MENRDEYNRLVGEAQCYRSVVTSMLEGLAKKHASLHKDLGRVGDDMTQAKGWLEELDKALASGKETALRRALAFYDRQADYERLARLIPDDLPF